MESPICNFISAHSGFVAFLQDLIEELSYLLRIPQRKPYGSMAKNTKEALEVRQSMHDCTKMHVLLPPYLIILFCDRLSYTVCRLFV
jgi:hypothetical protein